MNRNARSARRGGDELVDWLLGLFLLWKALAGASRGLLLGIFDLLGAVLTLGVALLEYASLGAWLASVASMPIPLANVVAFVGLAFATDLVYGIVLRLVATAAWPVLLPFGVFKPLNHLLGIAPGLIRGLLVATPVLLVTSLVSVVVGRQTSAALRQLARRRGAVRSGPVATESGQSLGVVSRPAVADQVSDVAGPGCSSGRIRRAPTSGVARPVR
jgi:uncharacterized membrane protein required for colicin V production